MKPLPKTQDTHEYLMARKRFENKNCVKKQDLC